jgi:ATP-binding cassette subfamily B protein
MVWPYRRRLTLAIVLASGAVVGVVLVPLLVGHAVNEITDRDRDGLVLAVVALSVVGVVIGVSQGARQRIALRVSLDVEYDVRNRFYEHLQRVQLGYIDEQQVGQLVSRGTVDLRQIRLFVGSGISSLAQDFGTILLAAGVMFALDADLAAITLSPVPVIIVTVVVYQRIIVPVLSELRRRIGVLSVIAVENISGVRLVRAFVREPVAIRRYREAAALMVEQAMRTVRLQATYIPTMNALPTLGLIAVLFYGGHQALSGSISVGEFTSFYTYVLILVEPASRIAYWMVIVQQAIAGAGRINEILSHPVEDPAAGAPPLADRPADLELRSAGLSFPGSGPVLSAIDLGAAPKRTVAVVGPTGSGKTTLLALINRLYIADSGVVEVDGRPVGQIELASLRRGASVAAMDDFLFSFSVRENIAYGRPDASDDEVREAARLAQAVEFIDKLPHGYDTPVGSRGVELSGGQRERISLARALLTHSQILLLDNPTGSLDADTEARALAALAEHLRDRTTVIVAYRVAPLALADEVVMLEEGRVVARGGHEHLLATNERYRTLVGGDDPGGSI